MTDNCGSSVDRYFFLNSIENNFHIRYIDPKFRKQHAGQALLRQLVMNLTVLNVERIETQVDWDQFDLLAFLAKNGFRPAPRLCLSRSLQD